MFLKEIKKWDEMENPRRLVASGGTSNCLMRFVSFPTKHGDYSRKD